MTLSGCSHRFRLLVVYQPAIRYCLLPHALHPKLLQSCTLLCAGVNVAKMLVARGDIVLIADSAGVRDIYSADGAALDTTTPLTVLVNKGTASASEVSDIYQDGL